MFRAYQREQPFNENHLAPCPIIDSPEILRKMVKECGARPTHKGAEQVLQGEVARYLDDSSQRWLQMANDYKAKTADKEKAMAEK